jgi:hypothetical protein
LRICIDDEEETIENMFVWCYFANVVGGQAEAVVTQALEKELRR